MKNHSWLKSLALLTSLATGSWLAGCGSSNNNNNNDGGGGAGGHAGNGGHGGAAGGGGTSPDGGLVDAGAISDGQIASVMIEANSGEVAAAAVALAKAMSPAVASFATMMVTDHTAANARLALVLQQQSITPEDSTVRQMLALQGSQTVSSLLATPAGAFDQAYVASQITMHMMVLRLLDDQLIPSVQNAALKTELQAERTTVMSHLTAAQQLSASLADGGVTDAGNNADATQGN